MDLRPYQQRVIDQVRAAYAAGRRAVLLQLPTGAGKTHVAASLLKSAVAKGKRGVFAAHRDDLIGDTLARLEAAGVHAGRIQAGETEDRFAPVQVCSLQTLHARPETLPRADVVIIDEAHRAVAPTVRGVLSRWPAARLLGLTATPERGDGTPLGDVFDHLVQGPSIRELEAEGILVPCDVVGPNSYSEDLAMSPKGALERFAAGRPALVFTSTVAEAKALAEQVPRAACVDGKMSMDSRREILAAYSRGDLDVLTNALVLTEGFNAPRATVCVLARGCEHAGTYLQIVGRVLRAHRGKERALLVDLRGLVHRHGLPSEPRTYSLHGRAISTATRLEPLRTCPICAAVFVTRPECPRCMFVFPPPPPAAVKPREVGAVTMASLRDTSGARAYFDELVAECHAKGWKPASVGMRFKARYSFWPPWRVPPAPPPQPQAQEVAG